MVGGAHGMGASGCEGGGAESGCEAMTTARLSLGLGVEERKRGRLDVDTWQWLAVLSRAPYVPPDPAGRRAQSG